MTLIERIIRIEEGREYQAYADPLTGGDPWTIGEGHTGPEVHKGLVWNDRQIDAAKATDIYEATQDCLKSFTWYAALDDVRKAVVTSLMFQMGIHRLLGFVHFLGAMHDQRWNAAAGELRDSKWHKQTTKRCERAARAIETGASQWESL